MAQIWYVIGKNGLESWAGTRMARFRHSFPEADKDGFVWLGKRPYVHDPARDVPEHWSDKKLMGIAFILSLLIGVFASLYIGYIGMSSGFAVGLIAAFFIGRIEHEDMGAYWRENEPDQINLADVKLTPGSIGMTGDYVREFGQAEHIRQALNQETNWIVIVAILAIILGVLSLITLIAMNVKPGA